MYIKYSHKKEKTKSKGKKQEERRAKDINKQFIKEYSNGQ